MTAHNTTSLGIMVAGQPASAPLRDFRAVARLLVGHFAANTPCGSLPGEQLHGDVTEFTVKCISIAVQMLDERRPPNESDLAELRAKASQWAREGVPLESVLTVYHEGIQIGWNLVSKRAGEGDTSDLIEAARMFVLLSEKVSIAASKSYVEELQSVASEHHTAAHTLVSSLLSGHNAVSIARQSGIELADSYLVLALSVPPHPDENDPAIQRTVAARRKLRRVQAELATVCGRSPLSMLSTEGGTVLIPGVQDEEWVEALVHRLSTAAEVQLTVTAEQAATADIPTAADQVHELLALAHQLHRPAGLYRMDDLVLEYQLTRPGPGRRHLRQILEPLDASPELLETLEIHISHDLNRQRSARQLHLHTNTVDYRLKRIAQLTGFDPTRPSGIRHLQAALVARRLEAAQGAA
ncbi:MULTISPECIES: PucR family transcriptional regulator [Nocardiaceae]|uniref:PucR family transcriptional regulator n=1 Tax=Nocardiaceae TaxID=85025 RepID=UPI0003767AF6|nr:MULTISPECIES: helix-turn-helix domain-containing protein [Rhodococcus]OZC55310.1 PucR family transcriptional regulator [Rhodococcus sp. 06-621-2]OZC58369.1 PucR family transcriptional regulator [Rhodococcus sp. RS1C4]OZC88205.1 PucR family transcriptional regulator [Rhodococcus sp. 06-418-1B]OZD11776.1 PucR family transcriptional regulator [Rhodococcus sp. 06-156-4C]OZD15620.1 PucR family transcriptional regulator [Rhodococcus sp. 06-156-4a]